MNKGLFKNLKFDLPSGLVVFVSGIIQRIVGGIVKDSLCKPAFGLCVGLSKIQQIDSEKTKE